MSTAPLLSIVIVNYKSAALTLDCLASIFRAPVPAMEIVVIDNASHDGSVEQIRAAYPHIRLIANTENTYFSAAYTQGVNLAHGQYVVVLNADMVVQGRALHQLLAQVQAEPGIGAATTTMFFPDGRLQRNGARHTSFGYLLLNYTLVGKVLRHPLEARKAWLWYADWDRTTARDIDVLPGSCIIARRETWLAAGAFDARMKMYFSDDYFSLRIKRLGLRTVYLVSEGIIHYEGASKSMSAWALRMYIRDLLVYTRLVFGRPAQWLLAILIFPTWLAQRLRL